MNQQLLGAWKSGIKMLDSLILTDAGCIMDGEHRKWNTMGNEIWLLQSDGKTGTKWSFIHEGRDSFVLHDPEDFTYMGHGEYIYFQMMDPATRLTFHRVQ